MIEYSEGFWITLTGLVIGFFGLTIRFCLKSKCDNVECCCFKIHRAVETEERIEERQIDYGVYDKEEGKV
jgi:hypothetical protein